MTDPEPIITKDELAIVAQLVDGVVPDDADDLATWVITAASDKVRATASQPLWTIVTAPPRARQICAHLAARTFNNPASVLSEGGVGPLGGDRFVQDLAMAMHLTDAEIAELEKLSPTGGGGVFWVQPVNATPAGPEDVYLRDSSGSDWAIPYGEASQYWAFG